MFYSKVTLSMPLTHLVTMMQNVDITVYCKSTELNEKGKVSVDSVRLTLMDDTDNFVKYSNGEFTLEQTAKWVKDTIDNCYKVEVKADEEIVIYTEE